MSDKNEENATLENEEPIEDGEVTQNDSKSAADNSNEVDETEDNEEEQEDPKDDDAVDEPATQKPTEPKSAAVEANDKFRGELSKIVSSGSSDEDDPKRKKKRRMKDKPARAPKKRYSNYVRDGPMQTSTFVMKLFDRSVDLMQFKADTPLYPICRAWFANNPKAGYLKKDMRRREDRERFGGARDNYSLPVPYPCMGQYLPAPPLKPYPLNEDFEIDYDPLLPQPEKEEMLEEHMTNWARVKAHFKKETAKRERRYKPSLNILRDLYYATVLPP